MVVLCFESNLLKERFPLVGFGVRLQGDRSPLGTTEFDVKVVAVTLLLALAADRLEDLEVTLSFPGIVKVQRLP